MDERIPHLQDRQFMEHAEFLGVDYPSIYMCKSKRGIKREDGGKDAYKLPHRLIEKKRRDRINECIGQLKDLLPEHLKLSTLGHLEKAVVLELTLKHLNALTAVTEQQHQKIIALQNGDRSMKSSIHADLDAFHSGFQACAKEVLQYLSQFENWTAREQRCAQLISHLHKVLAQVQPGAPLLQHQLPAGDAQEGQKADSQANCVPVIQRTQGGELNENDTDTDSGYGGEAEKSDGKDKDCARNKGQGPKAVKIKQEFGDERAAKKPKMSWSGNGLGGADASRPDLALMNSLMGISSVGQQTPICMPFYFINPSAAASYMPLFDKSNIEKYMYPAAAADLQSVIGALTAKGKECGAQGPNKFILLSESGSCNNGSFCQAAAEVDGVSTIRADGQPVKVETMRKPPGAKPLTGIKSLNKELECRPLDESLTNIQWLGRMSPSTLEPAPPKQVTGKENRDQDVQALQAQDKPAEEEAVQQPTSERPPYSYMAMIQFAINSQKNRRMTLKEIYTWIEDHFPYFREVAKPGWKNSIRHNLSLHDMFIRDTSPDGKVSFWTIRPEANRCLTLDQVYRPGCDPMTAPVHVPMLLFPHQQQKKVLPDARKTQTGSERKMKPLLPRTDSYLVPIQLPVTSSVYLPSSSAPFLLSSSQQKRNISRGTKRVWIAPKVEKSDAPAVVLFPEKSDGYQREIKQEPVCVPIKCETPKAPPRRQASSSRRKQRLIRSVHEEPVLLCPDNTFFDSGVASDASMFHDMQDTTVDEQKPDQHTPEREFSFKTPIKSNSQLTSSTPSKPPSNAAPEPWKVTPVGKGRQDVLDFSPIRTPGGPAVTPRHDYNSFSFSSTPFKDWPLFNSPRELLNSAPSRVTEPSDSPTDGPQSSCSRELLQAGGGTPTNRSITEGFVLDTMNDSLSKILVDISFSCLDDDDLGMANISWSEYIPQFK